MKKLRWQLLVVVLSLVAIGALLISQQPNAEPGGEPALQPTSGGTYIEALVGSFGRLNPVLDFYNSGDHDINRLLYCSLVRFDPNGQPVGDLAETWGISQDGTAYNFSIRPDAVWHDGQPITADDILFTVDLLRNDDMPTPDDLREFWKQVEVEIIDEKLVQFRLPEAFAPFMDYLTFGVLPSHLLANLSPDALINDPFNLKPVGCGPYRYDGLDVEGNAVQAVRLALFDDYYAQKPFIEQVIFRYYVDSASALEAYRQGEVMGISQITPDVLSQALTEPELNLYTARLPRLTMVYLNLSNEEMTFFQDAEVRRALLKGMNRQWIIDRLMGGQAILANGPILPDTWAYYDGVEKLTFDTTAALDILKQAGYTYPPEGGDVRSKDGKNLSFELLHPDAAPYPDIAASIQRDWEKLGVRVTLKAVPYEQLVSDYLETHTYEAALVDLNLARSPDPDPYPFWHQAQITGGQNYAGWDDRQASEYLEQARVQVEPAERLKRYRNFQVRFNDELPALPMFYPVYTYGVDEQVRGVSVGPMFDPADRFNTLPEWFLLARRATGPTETPNP